MCRHTNHSDWFHRNVQTCQPFRMIPWKCTDVPTIRNDSTEMCRCANHSEWFHGNVQTCQPFGMITWKCVDVPTIRNDSMEMCRCANHSEWFHGNLQTCQQFRMITQKLYTQANHIEIGTIGKPAHTQTCTHTHITHSGITHTAGRHTHTHTHTHTQTQLASCRGRCLTPQSRTFNTLSILMLVIWTHRTLPFAIVL